MSDKEFTPSGVRNFWFIDVLVVLIFLSTAAISVYLFRQDLMQTLEARDEEPAGIIIVRNNVIQRRYADRVLWERIFVDSPVYSGDLIRAADLSDATIHLDNNQIGLNENTLIRIQQSQDGSGSFHVDLREGTLNVTTGESAGIVLNIMGRQVQANPGTVLNAELGEEGLVVQVSEGAAVFVEEGQSRELADGMMIAQDARGVELKAAAAVVIRPQPNARYLKNSPEPLPVDFIWKKMNLDITETLRLEIASDKNFNRDFRAIDGLDSSTRLGFNAGNWYWRLLCRDAVLGVGEITVADASGPELISPVSGSVFRYSGDLPQLRFQWSERPGSSRYVLEVCDAPDFVKPQISRQLVSASFIQSELGAGTWYWRVLPVFPSVYENSILQAAAGYSAVSYFQIEKTADSQKPAFELSAAVPVIAPSQPPVTASTPPPPPPPQPKPPAAGNQAPAIAPSKGRHYTVKSGDTLGKIAEREYGDSLLWRKIFEANNIQNRDLIYIDQVLYIP